MAARASRSTSRPGLRARVAARVRNRVAAGLAPLRWWARRRPRPHGLPADLVVTLTSHPPRFGGLAFALRSLLAQTIRPDRVVLWLSPEARTQLPAAVADLPGLEVRTTPDLGPYTKIVPALRAFPDAFLATADDDTFYPPTWLADLVDQWPRERDVVVCHRAHRVALAPDGRPLPYTRWQAEIDGPARGPDIFPTGVGGVLYPPGCLPAETLDVEVFRALAPRVDDIWLYVMGRSAGLTYLKVGPHRPLVNWPGSQAAGLTHGNVVGGENDVSLMRLIDRFGWPPVRL